jgi:hypothetical protein
MAPVRPRLQERRQDRLKVVGLGRLERPTSPLSGVRSNHLSYRPLAGNGPKAQAPPRAAICAAARMLVEERETKAARSRL